MELTTMKNLFLNDIGFCGLWLPKLGTGGLKVALDIQQ
jgi:hypothetical protein